MKTIFSAVFLWFLVLGSMQGSVGEQRTVETSAQPCAPPRDRGPYRTARRSKQSRDISRAGSKISVGRADRLGRRNCFPDRKWRPKW